MTQDELALRLGVSRQAVSRWETGSSVPDVELLLKISELYGITINAILHTHASTLRVRERNPLVDSKLNPKKIFVIGCGRWGTFLSWYLDKIGHKVSLYGRENSVNMQRLQTWHKNDYLILPESVRLTTILEEAAEADYEATLFSQHSQNRCYGEAIAIGKGYDKLAEGVHTVKALRNLGKNYGIELPICEAVYQILYNNKQPRLILERLFSRSLKSEF